MDTRAISRDQVQTHRPGDRWQAHRPGDRWRAHRPGDRWQAHRPGDRWQAHRPRDRWQLQEIEEEEAEAGFLAKKMKKLLLRRHTRSFLHVGAPGDVDKRVDWHACFWTVCRSMQLCMKLG